MKGYLELRGFVRSGSGEQGQCDRHAAQELTEEVQGRTPLLPTGPPPFRKVYQLVGDFYQGKQDYAKALGYARKQVAVALPRDQGRLLNRVAALHDLLQQPDAAVATRKEAVKHLRAQLGPTPARSIFAAQMTGDLFEALNGIPTTTLAEKKAAAALVLDHPVAPAALKEKVRKALADLEPK